MATYIETEDVNILIDPGVALAPRRYGLPPHELELRKLDEDWKKIVKYSDKSDILIITHYHYDHHSPKKFVEDIYTDKVVLLKDPNNNINPSQSARGNFFLSKIKDVILNFKVADGKVFKYGNTKIEFSNPVPHGIDNRLGYVLEVYITDRKHSFLFTSDVEGPPLNEQINFILTKNPNIIYVDGPMTYMVERRYPQKFIDASIENLMKICKLSNLHVLILDHHLMRDLNWKAWVGCIYEECKVNKVWIGTAAEFMGQKPNLLEANRANLYKGEYSPTI